MTPAAKTDQPTCKVMMRSGKVYLVTGTRQAVADVLWPTPTEGASARLLMRRDLLLVDGTTVTINAGYVEGVEEG